MAKVTKGGGIISSGPGIAGFFVSWDRLNTWLGSTLQDQRIRLAAVRGSGGSLGGGGGGVAWQDGYTEARTNAQRSVRRATGSKDVPPNEPQPPDGTDKGNGYAAAKAAAVLAILAIEPS